MPKTWFTIILLTIFYILALLRDSMRLCVVHVLYNLHYFKF